MSAGELALIAWSATGPGALALFCRWITRRALVLPASPFPSFLIAWACTSTGIAFADLVAGAWAPTAIACAQAAVATWLLRRRRSKRAPRAYGAKSLARLARLAASMREARQLRPAPGTAPS